MDTDVVGCEVGADLGEEAHLSHTPLSLHMHTCIRHLYSLLYRYIFTDVMQCCQIQSRCPLPPIYTPVYGICTFLCTEIY